MRLMSDVPLGVFLSGGIDSSLIAALMRGMVAETNQNLLRRLRRGAVQRTGLRRARSRATLDTDHHEVRVSMDDFFDALPRLIWHEDEPIAWPSSVSLYFVSQSGRARSQSGAHRRRQRRTVRRLRPLRLHPAQ